MSTTKMTKTQYEKQLKNAKRRIKRREEKILEQETKITELETALITAGSRIRHLSNRRNEAILSLKKASRTVDTLISQMEVCP